MVHIIERRPSTTPWLEVLCPKGNAHRKPGCNCEEPFSKCNGEREEPGFVSQGILHPSSILPQETNVLKNLRDNTGVQSLLWGLYKD